MENNELTLKKVALNGLNMALVMGAYYGVSVWGVKKLFKAVYDFYKEVDTEQEKETKESA